MSSREEKPFFFGIQKPNQYTLGVSTTNTQEDGKMPNIQHPYPFSQSPTIARDCSNSQTTNLRDSASQFSFCDPFSGTQHFFPYSNSITHFNPYSSSLIQQQPLLIPYPSSHHCNPSLHPDYPQNQSNFSVELTPENFSLDLETPPELFEEKKPDCINRRSKLIDKQWTVDDDYYLKECVERYRNDWKKVFKEFKKRYKYVTIAFLKTKYKTIKTNPFELRVRFTHDEDLLIAKLVNSLGKKWDLMATYFPNRTPIMIKNRYYSYIKKRNIMKELLAEAEGKDSNSDSVETINADNSSYDSNPSYKSTPKILNLECDLFEDTVDQFFTFGPEDQLNERITPFSDFECHFDDDIEIMACAARKTTSMPEGIPYDHIIDPRSSRMVHSSMFPNDIFSQPVDAPTDNFPGNGPSFQDSNLKK